jgi:hypothetical protein
MKKSKINLIEVGSSIDDYKDGYVIPLTQIKKCFNLQIQGIYAVKIETRDGFIFSITTANARNPGKEGSLQLCELINSIAILANNSKNFSSSRIEPDSKVCSNCGEKLENFWNFCNNCGNELAEQK